MQQFIIKGPTKLAGAVNISGAKNAALPIIAASLLIRDKVTLKNVPKIKDVLSLLQIIKEMGVECDWNKDILYLNSTNLKKFSPDPVLVRNLRASVLLAGPILARNHAISFPHPGGCLIGSRPIDVHVNALIRMGAKISQEKEGYILQSDHLKAVQVSAEFSVTATENIIMAAVLTSGVTEIVLAAAEPHVQDLCHFLIRAGANISGIGTHNIMITGVRTLKPVIHPIIYDQIESGTFAIAIAASGGEGTINGFVAAHHESLLTKFDQIGIKYRIIDSDTIKILKSPQMKSFKIRTEIYPGFPTDLQAPMAVLATQCDGTTEIHETIFEGRMGYASELAKMGAACIGRDAHQLSITGPTPLLGTRITSFDLRAGATLIIAAICAEGESRLDQIEIIDRGYENIEGKLKGLGAKIRRVTLREIESDA